MKTKILVLGRSGAGKDTLVQSLIKDYNYTQVLSYATRPKRTPDENTHIFITQEEAKQYEGQKAAFTTFGQYEYFATKQQILENDIYVIDPVGCWQVLENMPDTNFLIVSVSAPEEVRKNRAVKRGTDPDTELERFNKRNDDEKDRFDQFEDLIYHGKNCFYDVVIVADEIREKYPNVLGILHIENRDFADPELANYVMQAHAGFVHSLALHPNEIETLESLEKEKERD